MTGILGEGSVASAEGGSMPSGVRYGEGCVHCHKTTVKFTADSWQFFASIDNRKNTVAVFHVTVKLTAVIHEIYG